jgi:hypothetical protein
MDHETIVPRLYVKSRGEQTTKLALQLTRAPRKFVVRITGGCGSMSSADAEGMHELYARAFVGYDGAMLFGGTRMVAVDAPHDVVPGITEVPPRLRSLCPHMVLLGVIPRTQDLGLSDHGMIVSKEDGKPFVTVVHPTQDIVLVVQVAADDPEVWDAEYQECLRVTEDLRAYADFGSALVSYNGGTVTRREVLATADRGWPVVLIAGSGRTTDELASDRTWLAAHRNVAVADKDPDALRRALASFGAVPETRLALVKGRIA